MSAAIQSTRRPAPPTIVTLSPWQQQQAGAIIQATRQNLLTENPDIAADPQLWLDTLDGETNIIDIIRALINAAIDAKMWADVTSQRKAEITTRADRAERNEQHLRNAVLNLMQLAGVDKVPDPEFSARVQKGLQYLDALDLNTLPPDYVDVTITRTPRKDRILADLRAGHSIQGASLRTATPYLVISRKCEQTMNISVNPHDPEASESRPSLGADRTKEISLMDRASAAPRATLLPSKPAEPPVSLTGIVLDAIRDPRVNLDRLQVLLRRAVLIASHNENIS